MSKVATHHVVLAGTKPTFAAAAALDAAEVGDGLTLIYRNGSGSTVTLTMLVPGKQLNNVDTDDTVYTIPTMDEAWIPLFGYLADPADSLAHWTVSSLTSGTRAVVKR